MADTFWRASRAPVKLLSATPDVYSPVVTGSGVAVVHRALEEQINGYVVRELSPYLGLCPPACSLLDAPPARITHTHPEMGPWVAHPESDLVATFHNYYLDAEVKTFSSPLQRLYYARVMAPSVQRSLQRARWVTAVSRFTADLVRRHHNGISDRLIVIPNGVDTRLFQPADVVKDRPVTVLFAGNPIKRKGVQLLCALADALIDEAVVVYTGSMRRSMLAAPPTTKNLLSLQAVPHAAMPDIYHQADILFFPSLREGFGLVVAEAMACGLPVVAADSSAVPELIDHGLGGYLTTPGDLGEMVQAVRRLIRDQGRRAAFGAYNRQKCVQKHDAERMIADYRQIFEMVS